MPCASSCSAARDHLVDRAVVAEVDHLGARGLQDAAHDVDRRVVAVEKGRGGEKADLVFRLVDELAGVRQVGHETASLVDVYVNVNHRPSLGLDTGVRDGAAPDGELLPGERGQLLGVEPRGSKASLPNASRTSGRLSTAWSSRETRSVMSRGRPFGPNTPPHGVTLRSFRPASASSARRAAARCGWGAAWRARAAFPRAPAAPRSPAWRWRSEPGRRAGRP